MIRVQYLILDKIREFIEILSCLIFNFEDFHMVGIFSDFELYQQVTLLS